ncbi:MAG: dienelactone hydrolase family protein [Proteobacteria bacterium]|nr:dienelactone hydrolase family protein [Pseudomonadota bacterium]
MTEHVPHQRVPNQRAIDLFDRYTHGGMDRRRFLEKLTILAGSSAAALALLPALENNYALAELLPEGDPRIKTETIDVNGTKVYLAHPSSGEKWPAVLVIHENRGLNPHIKDVTRRLAAEGFLAGGADFLSAAGGTPPDEDKAREMIGALDKAATELAARDVVAALRARPDSNGKVGAVGFCWGGGLINRLAVIDPTLDAAVAYYGMQPDAKDVAKIKAPLLLHYAGLDERINAGIPAYEAALKAEGKAFELHMYDGVNHAFNNDTNTARYDKKAADLAWSRTVAFLHKSLG